MKGTRPIKNDCANCAYCVKHYAKARGCFYIINDKAGCSNIKMTLRERAKAKKNKIICEQFMPEVLQDETEFNRLEYALCGIMTELHEINEVLKNKTN